jgi:hypothetical protein
MSHKLNIMYWNANGISNKVLELYNYMDTNHIHICCLSETFLKHNTKITTHPDYQFIRRDRHDAAKGGVAIIIRKSIQHAIAPSINLYLLENIGIEITLEDGSKIIIYSVYLPGGSDSYSINNHLRNDLRVLTNIKHNFFICGDFNARHRFWNCSKANLAGNILYQEFCNNYFQIIYPDEHTYLPSDSNRSSSTIDLAITNGNLTTTNPICTNLISDHCAVSFSIETSSQPRSRLERLTLDYSKANWEKFKSIIKSHINITSLDTSSVTSTEQIDRHVEKFTNLLNVARDNSVPLAIHTQYKINLPNSLQN